jgi:hypothetical protein
VIETANPDNFRACNGFAYFCLFAVGFLIAEFHFLTLKIRWTQKCCGQKNYSRAKICLLYRKNAFLAVFMGFF